MRIVKEQKCGHNIIRLFSNENEYIVYHYDASLYGTIFSLSIKPFTDYDKAMAEYNGMVARYK